jgi:hypothetical protein
MNEIYMELEKRHPERRHKLGDEPPAPVPLIACTRCGSQPRPAFLYALYGCPCYKVRCACGQQTTPDPWAVGLIFCDDPHTVTEPEALRNACDRWNAEQLRTIRAAAVPAAGEV